MNRVVISGIGAVCNIGSTATEFWNSCLAGRTVVSAIPERWKNYSDFKSQVWAPLPTIDYAGRGITRVETLQKDKFSVLAEIAALEAVENAGLTLQTRNKRQNSYAIKGLDTHKIGVYLGTGIGGANTFLSNHAHQILAKQFERLNALHNGLALDRETRDAITALSQQWAYPPRFNPFVVSMLMPNAAAANLGIKFSCLGPNQTFALACAAGTAAIGHAYNAIRDGEIDIAISGGAEYLYDAYGGIFRGFDSANTLAYCDGDSLTCNRPFDSDRTGFLFSEGGAAILILEDLSHATARNAPIIAEIIGYGESFDGYSMMSIEPDGKEIEQMLVTAIESARLTPSDVDLVNAHGTGTELNDRIECNVLDRLFGAKPTVTSTKSLTGHSIGASGALEAAATALSLRDQVTHVSKNLDNPIAKLGFATSQTQGAFSHAISESFAFGGHNAVLVMSRFVA